MFDLNFPERWELKRMKYSFNEISIKGYSNEPLLVASQNMGVVPKEIYGQRTVEATKDLHLLKLVEVGNFVISLRSFQGGIEYAYYRGIISPAYTILKGNGTYYGHYFRYLAKSVPFIEMLKTCVTGIREGQNIDYSILRKKFLPVPPLDEQEKIVRYLDKKTSDMTKFIDAKKKQVELLKELKRSIISDAVTNGLYNSPLKSTGIDWLPKIPEDWKFVRLKNIAIKLLRNVRTQDELLVCSNSGKVFFKGDSKIGLVSQSEKIYQGVRRGDLLIHGMDTWHGAIAVSDFDGKCTPVVHVCHSEENKKFIAYFMQALSFFGLYKKISNGVRENTSDFRSWSKAGNIFVFVPPLWEQKEIADYLDVECAKIENLIEALQKEISLVEELRKSLISEVVTGKIDVRELI